MIIKKMPRRIKYLILFISLNGWLGFLFVNMSNVKARSLFESVPDVCSSGGKNLDCFKKFLHESGEYKTTQDISLALKSLNEICSQKPINEANKKICYYSAINNTFEKIDYTKLFLHINHTAKATAKKSFRANEKKALDKLLRQQRAHIAKLYKSENSPELKYKILQVIVTLDAKTTELAKY